MNAPELALPAHIAAEKQEAATRAKQLPDPVGYKMLLMLPEQEKTYESGLLKADQTVHNDEVASVVAFVAKMGPDCYKDTAKFPTGPWCKEGDFVIVRPYSGTRVVVHGREMRFVNDDAIEGTVEDPRGIKRVGG
jgi:co-chaperonin GroES (HSP10)